MSEQPVNPQDDEGSVSDHIDVEELEEMPIDVAGEEIVTEVIEEVVEAVDDDLESEIVVDDGDIIYEEEEAEGYLEAFGDNMSLNNDRNLLYDIYQPHLTPNNTWMCKICMRAAKNVEYPDRNSFVAHRYKCHGSFNNNVICPMENCTEVYASLFTLRRHLSQDHELPLEVHLQSYLNIGEFEKARHLVEIAYGCRYMMHTKQPKYRRQVMHCAKSEHKLVLQTQKHRLPRTRMHKEGSACPSVISYRVDPLNGHVHAFMQLFHIGHDADSDATIVGKSRELKPMDIIFPIKPPLFAERVMQYVQIDVLEMQPAVYGSKMYGALLLVTCLKSRFMWARPMFEQTRTAIGRLLNSIFNEFGVPEGFSTTFLPTYVRDTVKSLESVYSVEIREVWAEPAPYSFLMNWILEMSEAELGTRNRWVEHVPFVMMEYNQKALSKDDKTPFVRMFQRKPPNLYSAEDEPDSVAAKCRAHHVELRKEEGDVNATLDTIFRVGDKVYLRKGITNPRRGNNSKFYYGIISAVTECKHFPYKVHFSENSSPWPTDRNMFVWSSVFDLLPTTHIIREMDFSERMSAIADLLCKCSGKNSQERLDLTALGDNAHHASKCPLMRSEHCANGMSKYCCKTEGRKTCRYHELYPEHDESYSKMGNCLVNFQQQNEIIEKKILEELENDAPMRELLEQEVQKRRMAGENITLEEVLQEAQEQHVLERPAPGQEGEKTIVLEEIHEEILIPDDTDVAFHYGGEEVGPSLQLQRIPREDAPGPSTSRMTTPRRVRKPSQIGEEKEKETEKTSKGEDEPPIKKKAEEVDGARRSSQRKIVRPKNFSDYVE